jgi:hypothetical protein
MMQDFAMHLLDLAHNSIRANANTLSIKISEAPRKDTFVLDLIDDGCGMDEDTLQKARDPFYTSRTTRRVGLGIPFLEGTSKQCDGTFHLESEVGKGTKIGASMSYRNIDRPPLGDIGSAIAMILQASPRLCLNLDYAYEDASFIFRSDEIKETLGEEVGIDEPEILLFIQDYVQEHINALKQGEKSE